MPHLLATAQPVFLMNPFYPALMTAVLIGWAWVLGKLDKDAAYFYLKRYYWNGAQIGCGVVGFGLMLLIPIFFLGFLVGLLVLVGGVLGYAYYRNTQVPADQRWSMNFDSFRRKIEARQLEAAQARAAVVLISHDGGRLEVPAPDSPQGAAHQALEQAATFALPRGADRIDLVVDANQAKLSVRIDGVKYAQPAPQPAVAMALIDYVKGAGGLDLAERRKRQHAEVRFDAGELGQHTFEVTAYGSTRGLALTLEIDTQLRARLPLTKLGLLQAQRDQLKQIVEMAGHIVLVSAPERQGTTTTLFSLVHEHDPYVAAVITLEDEKTFELEGVNHTYLPEGASPTQFNERLAQMLRSDPQVVMLTRLADNQTARQVAHSAEAVRFYIPLPAADTFAALKSWSQLVGDAKAAGSAVGAIVSQRLVRKLCPTCKTPYKPDAEALRKLNIPTDKAGQFFSASGKVVVKDKPQTCPSCQGLGYKGRVGVFELMVLDKPARKLAAAGDLDGLRSHLRKQKMLYLQESALAKVVDGTTDIKEVTRALGEGK